MFNLWVASPAVIDIKSRTSEISALSDFGPTLEGLIRSLLYVAALATFLYMIWGAFDWVMSGGDSGKLESAKKKITQSIIGLAVLMSIGAIFMVVQYVLGIDVLQP